MRTRTMRYILENDQAVPCFDLHTWAEWMETANRQIADDTIDGVRISTVFLGLDHAYPFSVLKAPVVPVLYETMIFGGEHNEYQERYTTRTKALAGHDRVVAAVRAGKSPTEEDENAGLHGGRQGEVQ